MPNVTARSHHDIYGNGKFYICLTPRQIIQPVETTRTLGLYSRNIQNNAYSWQSPCILYQLPLMTNMSDEIVLARNMTALD